MICLSVKLILNVEPCFSPVLILTCGVWAASLGVCWCVLTLSSVLAVLTLAGLAIIQQPVAFVTTAVIAIEHAHTLMITTVVSEGTEVDHWGRRAARRKQQSSEACRTNIYVPSDTSVSGLDPNYWTSGATSCPTIQTWTAKLVRACLSCWSLQRNFIKGSTAADHSRRNIDEPAHSFMKQQQNQRVSSWWSSESISAWWTWREFK